MESWSKTSLQLTKKISKEIKKSNGIYFTPYEIVKDTIKLIKNDRTEFVNILEPSCGSCQFIDILNNELKFESIYGVEKNEKIFQTIDKLKFKNNVKLFNTDFLNYSSEILFDLIIGNPPYFVIPKKDVSKEYLSYFDGRPNIYSIFIIKCLKLLNKYGILAFVLPKNFLNCIYYNKLRKYIYSKFKILGIVDHSEKSYLETAQDTCVLIVQNDKTNNNNNDIFTIKKGDLIIFNTPENIEKINKLYEGSISLNDLGFTVSIGTVVWNQVKDMLTNDSSKTLLIYSSDIKNNSLVPQKYSNDSKKNYIDVPGLTETCLIINRGYGTGKYTFNFCLIDGNQEYLIENHLIVIKNKEKSNYELLLNSFKNEKTSQFIDLLFGNNAINCQELLHLFPIY